MVSLIGDITPPNPILSSPEKKRKDTEKEETLNLSDLILSSPEKQAKTTPRSHSTTASRNLKLAFGSQAPAAEGISGLADSDDDTPSPNKVDVDESLLELEVELAKRSPLLQTKSKHAPKVDLTKIAQALCEGRLGRLQELLQKANDPIETLAKAKEKAIPADHPLFERLLQVNQAGFATLGERHTVKLSTSSLLKLQLAAQNQMKSGNDTCYLPRVATKRSRAMITSGQSFFILSKDAGPEVKRGSVKKITQLLAIMDGGQRISYNDYVAISNQAGDEVEPDEAEKEVAKMSREFKIATLFNHDVLAFVEHKNKDGKAKCRWIEERYHTDLRPFLLFGKKVNSERLTAERTLFILRQVAYQLGIIHAARFVHNDLNGGNIVIKEMPINTLKVKINDFGASYNLTADFPREDERGYGTSANTAPEYFGSAPMLSDPIEQGQAEDMYAIGCLLYSLIYGVEIPWALVARKAVEETPQKDVPVDPAKLNKEALEEMAAEHKKIDDDANNQTGLLKLLYTLCLACLDPNPQTRMKIQRFNSALAAL